MLTTGIPPAEISLPTGLGKTSVMTLWLLALSASPMRVPRRLVWVVNRRVVVDQATEDAEKLAAALQLDENSEIRGRLSALSVTGKPLAVSTLRGQKADNREWSVDPARPAIIVGTVDMVGSRLLFSGYGDGRVQRPHHAGLLGHDALIVNDEAHLTPAFADLLEALQGKIASQNAGKPFRVMRVSATQKSANAGFPASLDQDLDQSKVFRTRYQSAKQLQLHETDNPQRYDKMLLDLATAEPRGRTIVFVQSPEKALKVLAEIRKRTGSDRVLLLTGTQRGHEREQLTKSGEFQDFASAASPLEPCWLVATSAGEVGVNISSERLVTEHDTADHLLQRFGRLNRFGETEGVAHVVRKVGAKEDPVRVAAWQYLQSLPPLEAGGHDISPRAVHLNPPPVAAMTAAPVVAPVRDWILDVWSQTSPHLLGFRPKVEPWLHGQTEAEPPETELAWRWDADILCQAEEDAVSEALRRFPVLPHERLRDTTKRTIEKLSALSLPDTRCLLIDRQGEVHALTIGDILKKAESAEYATLLLPEKCCRLQQGMFDPQERESAGPADVAEWNTPRCRTKNDEEPSPGWKQVAEVAVEADEFDPEAEPQRVRYWREAPYDATSGYEETLASHLKRVAKIAAALGAKLQLPQEIRTALVEAAEAHDRGKANPSWQRAMDGDVNQPLAKTKGGKPRLMAGFRHELQSAREMEAGDLAQHLVASHHGWGRPHFMVEAYDRRALKSSDAAMYDGCRRFADLTERYGHWGLAYLEAVFRAADWLASQEAEEQHAEA